MSTSGRVPDWLRPGRVAALLALAGAGCILFSPGLDPLPGLATDAGDGMPGPRDGGCCGGNAPDAARRPDAPPPLSHEPEGLTGSAGLVGCADGSREGFPSLGDWPDIAGCSGAWSVPGLLNADAREPRCGRAGGNSGPRPDGAGCSVADLCAAGWHVCRSSSEVSMRSPSGCETAVVDPGTTQRFFLVRAGASPQGLCIPEPFGVNDLHGCGTLGQPAQGNYCHPLHRRMSFVDCAATAGVWSCGGAAEFDREAEVVTKSGSALGGVLCCRD